MTTGLQMGFQLEQIHGEIRDHFRALANGFQKLDKIRDANRRSKQLEELTGKMRECKRLIKDFDCGLKEEEHGKPPEVNKQLHDEKQSMIKELNSYVALRKTHLSSLDTKRVELFDMGAGASEPTAEDNVQMTSTMTNQELINHGHQAMDETDQAIERSKQVWLYLFDTIRTLLQIETFYHAYLKVFTTFAKRGDTTVVIGKVQSVVIG